MNNLNAATPCLSASALRQLEITFNQLNRSLRRALRVAELEPLSPDLNLLAQVHPEHLSFELLAQAAGPAWQAVQLRCSMLKVIVNLTESIYALSQPSASVPDLPEPPPAAIQPQIDASPEIDHVGEPNEDLFHDLPSIEEMTTMSLEDLVATRDIMFSRLASQNGLQNGLTSPAESPQPGSPVRLPTAPPFA